MKIKNLEHPKTMPSLENRLIDQKVKDLINVIQEMEGLIENPARVGVKAEIGVTEMEAIVTTDQAIEEKALKEMTETIDQRVEVLAIQIEEIKDLKSHTVMVGM